MASALYIRKNKRSVHFFQCCHLVHRSARFRIYRRHCNHTADLKIRIYSMTFDYGQCGCYKFMMGNLIQNFISVFAFFIQYAGIGKSSKCRIYIPLIVNLVKRHPIFNFIFITAEHRYCKTHKEINQLAVAPAAVFFYQMIRHFKMRQRNNRLHTVTI